MTFRNDETIQCVRCGRHFTWSYGEQRYYRENNLHRPKRCPRCRPIAKAEREALHTEQLVIVPQPQPELPGEKVPSPVERPSWWADPHNRNNVLLGLLTALGIVILLMLFLELF